jgi:O-methyltransferase
MNLSKFISIVSPYSMTSIQRITELFNSLEYILNHNIPGDIVECGVWKGGNILGIIEYLYYHNITDKKIWLFDTFSGMTEPSNIDIDHRGYKAKDILHVENVKAYASLKEVQSNLYNSNFDKSNICYVVGDIIQTLQDPINIPENISLLRLDTDWYESTKSELLHLYPKLVSNGVLIIDDYGHWAGCRRAVDEYFSGCTISLKQIDYTGIKIIKK